MRVHTAADATRLTTRLNTAALTVGQDVVFGDRNYRSGTPFGDALIAHELAHVVQQKAAMEGESAKQEGEASNTALEQEADRSAAGAVPPLWRNVRSSVVAITDVDGILCESDNVATYNHQPHYPEPDQLESNKR